jgi:hypothetical protein
VTHIDPFAPGDSPQHPANWVDEPSQRVQDALANLYQWRRDHFARASEADADLSADELEARHERHADYLEAFGLPDERTPDADFIPMPELLRRAIFDELDSEEQIAEWKQLFELHSTDDERDPAWVEEILPDLDELRARAQVAELSSAAARIEEQAPPTTEAPAELPSAPKSNALKEEWVEYALAVSKARGEDLTPEQAETMTTAELKAAYKPQAS